MRLGRPNTRRAAEPRPSPGRLRVKRPGRVGLGALCLALIALPARSMDEYGGGWAVPSLDTAVSIGNGALDHELQLSVLRGGRGRDRGVGGGADGAGFFASALGVRAAPVRPAAVETSFRRSRVVEAQAHANILAALGKRQPEAAAEYRRLFATADLPAGFEDVLRPYGLRADDAADALAAYWVMAWVVARRIADDSGLPSPQAVRAVRDQVVQALALGPTGNYDATRRQMLADESIFNFLVLNQAWRAVRHEPTQFERLATATRNNFLALGADLDRIDLGRGGFVVQ